MRDFAGRCAYSCQHVSRAGGPKCMEVDHFDPRRKKDVVQNYENLFLSTRHCNGAKRDRPTAKERAAGLRFINPCKEWDYGKHLFEDPQTHRLVGVSPEGIYHIRCCDLNAPHLIDERRDRAYIRGLGITVNHPGSLDASTDAIRALLAQVDLMIPAFPYLTLPAPTPSPPQSVAAAH